MNLLVLLLGVACYPPPEQAESKGNDSAPPTDSRPTDSGPTDTGPTDSGPTDTTDTGPTGPDDPIVGYWGSEGANLAPVFASVYSRVEASFAASGDYAFAGVAIADGEVDILSGIYTVDTSVSPHTITLAQTEPAEAISEGIWWASDGSLQIEVVPTTASSPLIPPTPESGFGSTSGPGVRPGDYLQVYVAL